MYLGSEQVLRRDHGEQQGIDSKPCFHDEAAFDDKLKAVAGQKPKSEKDEVSQRPRAFRV
jgi:hypothetical protein